MTSINYSEMSWEDLKQKSLEMSTKIGEVKGDSAKVAEVVEAYKPIINEIKRRAAALKK